MNIEDHQLMAIKIKEALAVQKKNNEIQEIENKDTKFQNYLSEQKRQYQIAELQKAYENYKNNNQ